ncbi:ATP-binding protein [Mucilaginibacter sp. PAMB04168]|uniref:ATP-binding protein n=1 Tax=Mucilaginibacter sp. PAMB04168 TaxID=3138567 RepID=UPI0031F66465
METSKSYQELLNELSDLRIQLEEATDTIDAIRSGEIDALVVKVNDGHQLYTLKSADQTYRIFIEQMTEGAVTLSTDGNILYSNSQFAGLVNSPLEKVIGKSFFSYVTDDCQLECKELIAKAWADNIKDELTLLAADGAELPVLLSLKTLDLDEGLALSIIITDLTGQKETQKLLKQKNAELEEAQKVAQHLNATLEHTVKERTRQLEKNIEEKTRVEEELRSNQQQLSRILETMAEGVGIIDVEGKLIYANPMAQKILGVKEHEILKRTYDDPKWQNLRIDGTPLPDGEHPMAVIMRTGEPLFDQEIAVQPPEGERFYISINAAPLRDDNGHIVGGIGTFMDVSIRRKNIQNKDEFISVASHELRTPVTSLKASLQLLSRMKDNPSPKMLPVLIDQANKSLNKLSVLISDLLNTTKMTEGQLHLNKSSVALSSLVTECCQNVHTEAGHEVVVTGNKDLQAYADADKIEQVITNLVNNVIKYAPDAKEIIINLEKQGSMAKVSVIDKGPGIPPEKLPNLFDRYYRVDNSGIQYSGLGLGLYICSEIIKRHNGQIGAESEYGNGSTFWFTLPLINA